jgi:hypothetical protein
MQQIKVAVDEADSPPDDETIQNIFAVFEDHTPAVTGLLIEVEDDYERMFPDEVECSLVPIQEESEARAVMAAISIYEHRQDSSLKSEASRVGKRVAAHWGI